MADQKAAETAKPMNKSTLLHELAQTTRLERKQVSDVLDALENLIKDQLGSEGPGVFALSDLLKIRRVIKPARPAGTKPNPFKPGEMMEVKAKGEEIVVKVVVLKGLKGLT
jgi:nucleoid DNA-binding protein